MRRDETIIVRRKTWMKSLEHYVTLGCFFSVWTCVGCFPGLQTKGSWCTVHLLIYVDVGGERQLIERLTDSERVGKLVLHTQDSIMLFENPSLPVNLV